MADETTESDPSPETEAAPSPAVPEPALARPEMSSDRMNRQFEAGLNQALAEMARENGTEPPEAAEEATPEEEEPEATPEPESEKPKARRKYDFGGEAGEIEIDEDDPRRGAFDKLQAEIRYRRRAEGEKANELAEARKELAALKAAKPEAPAKAAATETDEDDIEAAKADLLDALDIDEDVAERLARRIARKSAAPESEALKTALAEIAEMKDLLGPQITEARKAKLEANSRIGVKTYAKREHKLDITDAQAEAIQSAAMSFYEEDAEAEPDEKPDVLFRRATNRAIFQVLGQTAPEPETKPAPPSKTKAAPTAAELAARLTKRGAPALMTIEDDDPKAADKKAFRKL